MSVTATPMPAESLEMTHVLIVDDDVRLADLIANYLRRQNLKASIAHSAAEARQLLAIYRFDLFGYGCDDAGRDRIGICWVVAATK